MITDCNIYECGEEDLGTAIIYMIEGDKCVHNSNVSHNRAKLVSILAAENMPKFSSSYTNYIGNVASNRLLLFTYCCDAYFERCKFYYNDGNGVNFYQAENGTSSMATYYNCNLSDYNMGRNVTITSDGDNIIGINDPYYSDHPYLSCKQFSSHFVNPCIQDIQTPAQLSAYKHVKNNRFSRFMVYSIARASLESFF